jgi:hypothetical protein
MTSKAALLALLTLWGVGTALPFPAYADDNTASESQSDSDDDVTDTDLTNRVWVKAGDEAALPGVIKIFLSDGTLVQDSCWETHRLDKWELTSDTALKWSEDSMDIAADIVSLSDAELVLNLKLKGGDQEEKYVAATVPYLCPDMPK